MGRLRVFVNGRYRENWKEEHPTFRVARRITWRNIFPAPEIGYVSRLKVVEIRDRTVVYAMQAREVTNAAERARLWKIAVAAYPPYEEYQARTTRQIPVFVAEPRAPNTQVVHN